MTPYGRAVELARQCVDDPLPVVVLKAMTEVLMRRARRTCQYCQQGVAFDPALNVQHGRKGVTLRACAEYWIRVEAAEYEQAVQEGKKDGT